MYTKSCKSNSRACHRSKPKVYDHHYHRSKKNHCPPEKKCDPLPLLTRDLLRVVERSESKSAVEVATEFLKHASWVDAETYSKIHLGETEHVPFFDVCHRLCDSSSIFKIEKGKCDYYEYCLTKLKVYVHDLPKHRKLYPFGCDTPSVCLEPDCDYNDQEKGYGKKAYLNLYVYPEKECEPKCPPKVCYRPEYDDCSSEDDCREDRCEYRRKGDSDLPILEESLQIVSKGDGGCSSEDCDDPKWKCVWHQIVKIFQATGLKECGKEYSVLEPCMCELFSKDAPYPYDFVAKLSEHSLVIEEGKDEAFQQALVDASLTLRDDGPDREAYESVIGVILEGEREQFYTAMEEGYHLNKYDIASIPDKVGLILNQFTLSDPDKASLNNFIANLWLQQGYERFKSAARKAMEDAGVLGTENDKENYIDEIFVQQKDVPEESKIQEDYVDQGLHDCFEENKIDAPEGFFDIVLPDVLCLYQKYRKECNEPCDSDSSSDSDSDCHDGHHPSDVKCYCIEGEWRKECLPCGKFKYYIEVDIHTLTDRYGKKCHHPPKGSNYVFCLKRPLKFERRKYPTSKCDEVCARG